MMVCPSSLPGLFGINQTFWNVQCFDVTSQLFPVLQVVHPGNLLSKWRARNPRTLLFLRWPCSACSPGLQCLQQPLPVSGLSSWYTEFSVWVLWLFCACMHVYVLVCVCTWCVCMHMCGVCMCVWGVYMCMCVQMCLCGMWVCICILCVQAHVCGVQRTTSSVITYFENVSQWPGVCWLG